jgi:hypothetical protein
VFCAALRLYALYASTLDQAVISLQPASSAVFTVPKPAMQMVRASLCGSLLYVRTLHWRVNGGTARPRYNSSLPLLSNLTTLDLLARCDGTLREVGSKGACCNQDAT